MVQTVRIRKEDNKIKLNFMYNTDLVDIMREHHGFFFRKEKAWVFPAHKQSELYNALVDNHYNVEFITPNVQTTFKTPEPPKEVSNDPWANPDTFMIMGTCKKCGKYTYVYKTGICARC